MNNGTARALRMLRDMGFALTLGLAAPGAQAQVAQATAAPASAGDELDAIEDLIDAGKPGDLDGAYERLQKVLVDQPQSARAHYLSAHYYAARGYRDEDDSYRGGALESALAEAQKAQELEPQWAAGFVYAGYLHRRLGQFPQAQEALDQARALHSGDAWLDMNQADLYADQGRIDDAIAAASSVVERGGAPGNPLWHGYRTLLELYCRKPDLPAAAAVYEQQRKRYPDDAWVPANYALFLARDAGAFELAARYARDSLAMHGERRVERTLGLALYGQWAQRVLAQHDDDAAARLFDEAEGHLPYLMLINDAGLKQGKLTLIGEALQADGMSLDQHGMFYLIIKQAAHKWVRERGLDQLGMTALAWPAGAAVLLLLAFVRSGSRRRPALAARPAPPPAAAPADTAPAAPLAPEALRFTGSGAEYFRIWIVNLVLMILTLGIYSAWAKVRRIKYFYRNTELAGARFDYHGSPVAILKGRLIAVALLLAYKYSFEISAQFGMATLTALALVFPWLLRNSFRFRLRNTSYRGIRFGFEGSPAGAYYVFLFGGIASLASFYLLAPLYHQRIKAYQHGNASFGMQRFTFGPEVPGFKAGAWPFYKIYLAAIGVSFLTIFAGFIPVGILAALAGKGHEKVVQVIMLGTFFTIYIGALLMAIPFFQSQVQNLVWNNTQLGAHRFRSSLSTGRLAWIYTGNLLGTVLTLGFYYPWAAVRLARYRVATLTALPAESFDLIAAAPEQDTPGAAGQEAAVQRRRLLRDRAGCRAGSGAAPARPPGGRRRALAALGPHRGGVPGRDAGGGRARLPVRAARAGARGRGARAAGCGRTVIARHARAGRRRAVPVHHLAP